MFNALESLQAFEVGQGQRKEREREAAMKTFGNALSMNDYEGASKIGFGIDPALGMQARQYGESQNALALNKQIAPLVASGNYTEAMTLAAPSGNLDLVTQLQQFKLNATDRERQEAAFKAEQLAKIAAGYEGMAPGQAAARWQQDQLALQRQGFDPAELAQFDPMDPQDLKDAVLAAQTLSDIQAGQRYDAEREYLEGRDTITDRQWERSFAADEAARRATAASAGKFGVTPVFARDERTGKRVILQTNNAGGVSQADLPEGLVLEDDYSRTFDRETAKEDAKKAAYESTAGQALTAFETKTDELLVQIDDAVEKTNKGNTGLIGQFIAAGDLDGVLDSIGAKAMLSELVAIKAQGGALGALSDSEGKALRDAAVNVARSQSEEQLDRNLKAYRLQVENSRMRLKQAFEEQYVNNVGGARPAGGSGQGRPVGPSGQPVPEGFE